MERTLKTLLAAAAVALCIPAFAAEMTADEAFALIEENATHCQIGKLYDGGPDLSEAEVKAACERYEAAKNRLIALGIAE